MKVDLKVRDLVEIAVSDTIYLDRFVPCGGGKLEVKLDEQGSLDSSRSTLLGKIFYTWKYMYIDFSAHNIFLIFHILKFLKSGVH